MGYNFAGKVALVTGAASGIGLGYTKGLLKNGAKGVAIVDINAENGIKIQIGLGKNTIFIKTDVTKKDELEEAFKETIKHFGHLDIVINNAGVLCENNWQFEISLNVNAVVHGVLLGFQYMRKDKGGRGGVILNTASVAGVEPVPASPIYAGTKAFVVQLGRAMGTDVYFKDTDIKVLTLCPGKVDTPIFNGMSFLEGFNIASNTLAVATMKMQTPEYVGDCMTEIMKRGRNGSCWIVTDNKPIFEYEFPSKKIL